MTARTCCVPTASFQYLDDLEVAHRFDGDVELDDAVVVAAADELAVDAMRRLHDARRLVDREESAVERRLLQHAEPQRRHRRTVVALREREKPGYGAPKT